MNSKPTDYMSKVTLQVSWNTKLKKTEILHHLVDLLAERGGEWSIVDPAAAQPPKRRKKRKPKAKKK